jgi:hypothetical protein
MYYIVDILKMDKNLILSEREIQVLLRVSVWMLHCVHQAAAERLHKGRVNSSHCKKCGRKFVI